MPKDYGTVKIYKRLFSFEVETGVGHLLYKRLSFHDVNELLKEITFACKKFSMEKLIVLWTVFLIVSCQVEYVLKVTRAKTIRQTWTYTFINFFIVIFLITAAKILFFIIRRKYYLKEVEDVCEHFNLTKFN